MIRHPLQLVYSPLYAVDIGPHVFVTDKYRLVRDRVFEGPLAAVTRLIEPEPASWVDLGRVHDARYLKRVQDGSLSPAEIATLELPWSPQLVEGFRLMVGGTVLAARQALADGMAMNLGGGLHHGFSRHGEGFCLFNDVAVAVRALMADGLVGRVAIVDLDVHHGNGTALIFSSEPSVFTFSMHQQHNYPAIKPPGTLDIGLPDRMGDAAYLSRLESALPAIVAHRPEIAFYLAGADPYEGDQLGGLSLTQGGLRERDRMVLRAMRQAAVPVAIVLAGGYAQQVADTVAIHLATVEEAARITQDSGRERS